MKSLTANWFLCKIRYEKTMEDGLQKKVTEQYVVGAQSFTDAEARIIGETADFGPEFEVAEIDRCVWNEVFFYEALEADKWYKAKLQFITIDEKTEKEKKTSVYYLVQAESFEAARQNIDEVMAGSMLDYVISSVSETKIIDVFGNFNK